jgi:hypothetical protein
LPGPGGIFTRSRAPRPQHHPGRLRIGRRRPEAITYQPASRYWRFQLTETAIYLALALALAGYCFWRLTRLS